MTDNSRDGRLVPPIPLLERPGMVNAEEPTDEAAIARRAREIADGMSAEISRDLDNLLRR